MDYPPPEQSRPTVLRSLGTFKIWTTLILTPLVGIGIVIVMIMVPHIQKDWKTSTATSTESINGCPRSSGKSENFTCSVKVKVADLGPQDYSLSVNSDRDSLRSGQTWTVAYDPKNPGDTLTTSVATASTRTWLEIGLGAGLVICILFFVINLALRKNEIWQNVSGVMEGADIASAVVRGWR